MADRCPTCGPPVRVDVQPIEAWHPFMASSHGRGWRRRCCAPLRLADPQYHTQSWLLCARCGFECPHVAGLREQVERLREALIKIRNDAGSNTICANFEPQDHEYGGIYRTADRALAITPSPAPATDEIYTEAWERDRTVAPAQASMPHPDIHIAVSPEAIDEALRNDPPPAPDPVKALLGSWKARGFDGGGLVDTNFVFSELAAAIRAMESAPSAAELDRLRARVAELEQRLSDEQDCGESLTEDACGGCMVCLRVMFADATRQRAEAIASRALLDVWRAQPEASRRGIVDRVRHLLDLPRVPADIMAIDAAIALLSDGAAAKDTP